MVQQKKKFSAKAMSKLPYKVVIHGKSHKSVDNAVKLLKKYKKKKDMSVVADLSDEKNFDIIYENTR